MTIAPGASRLVVTRPDAPRPVGNRSEAHTVKRGSAQVPLVQATGAGDPYLPHGDHVTVAVGVDNTL